MEMELKFTKEQQCLWDEAYIQHGVMARLLDGYDFYQETSFDAYQAYDYLKSIYKLNEEDAWWTMNDKDRIILHVDEYRNNGKQDLMLRKEYIKTRMKISGVNRSLRILLGIKHLAKVIGYDRPDSNWGDPNEGNITIIEEFPLDRYRSLFIYKMNPKLDINEYYFY